ncbi:TetR/AcrR family transcriptional regulator [Pseudomonas chengduensis]|jgi:AcrR family transcriptional regulator|uniref:Transcriptional regulator, TetR family n=1 Tax=Ectopseudomonas toyotomiensis TaxID=554344 RepID=A0A1I5UMZ2_9GAMM|nr:MULTISPECIES: TetR/AcrR family transcriptional regulator [Pseudomonas]MBG0848405.1 TetR/AcrR family transcriptional regulator [Pseudomonas chengduensis]MDH1212532.1 TetR/AcrR family transcriptional regulator [Pseudomonas chengduensis]MDI5993466.1 helix-turn-helix domain-containing protein [Pseudomonas sp. MDMC216]MDI6008893.1 helix-turn-helix domain-containing protein [Pseudomonas sp. MDMC17]PIA73287.1 TetR family transcriptional regulator [Pseudomonas toyotomiensis]
MRYQDQLFQQRENALLQSARQLFQEQSWDRVTIAEVARHAGIGKGTVYKHFSSKEALYARLVLDCSRQHLSELRETANQAPPREAMRHVIRRAFEQLLADPLQAQLCLLCDRPAFQERLDAPYREQFLELEGQYMALFNQLLQGSFSELQLSPTDCQRLLWGVEACVNGVMARIASGGFAHWAEPIELDAYFQRVTDFIIAGLQGQAAALHAAPVLSE